VSKWHVFACHIQNVAYDTAIHRCQMMTFQNNWSKDTLNWYDTQYRVNWHTWRLGVSPLLKLVCVSLTHISFYKCVRFLFTIYEDHTQNLFQIRHTSNVAYVWQTDTAAVSKWHAWRSCVSIIHSTCVILTYDFWRSSILHLCTACHMRYTL
jgi:hypothetical protein